MVRGGIMDSHQSPPHLSSSDGEGIDGRCRKVVDGLKYIMI